MIVDDVHWADAASVSALRHLVRSAEAPPLLVLATSRPTDDPSAVTVAEDVRRSGGRVLSLDPLSENEIGALAACSERAIALAIDPAQLDSWLLQLAGLLTTTGEPARAETLARDLLDHTRPTADATRTQVTLARALFAQGRTAEVVNLLDEVTAAATDGADSTRLLDEAAFFLCSTGEFAAAAAYARTALRRDAVAPDDIGEYAESANQATSATDP